MDAGAADNPLGMLTLYADEQCVFWSCRRFPREGSFFCSDHHEQRAVAESHYTVPHSLGSIYTMKDVESFVLSKIIAMMSQQPPVNTGVPDLTGNVQLLATHPWEQQGVFNTDDMTMRDESKIWVFIGRYYPDPDIWIAGNILRRNKVRTVHRSNTDLAVGSLYSLYRYTIVNSPNRALYVLFFDTTRDEAGGGAGRGRGRGGRGRGRGRGAVRGRGRGRGAGPGRGGAGLEQAVDGEGEGQNEFGNDENMDPPNLGHATLNYSDVQLSFLGDGSSGRSFFLGERMLKFLSKVRIEFSTLDPRLASSVEFLAQCNARKAKESNPNCQGLVKRRTDEQPLQITVTFVNGVEEAFDAAATSAQSIRKMILDKCQYLETEQMFREAVGCSSGEVTLWEVGSREKVVTEPFKIWNMAACSVIFQGSIVKDPSISVTRVAWSPDGNLIGVSFTKHLIHVYAYQGSDLRQHLEIDAHVGCVNDLAFAHPNKQMCVVTCGDEKLIKVLKDDLWPVIIHEEGIHQEAPGVKGEATDGKAPWQGVRNRCQKEWTMFQSRMASAEIISNL